MSEPVSEENIERTRHPTKHILEVINRHHDIPQKPQRLE